MLAFAGGLGTYMTICNESVERGYDGFAISEAFESTVS